MKLQTNILELEQKSILITGIIIVLAVLLGYVLSTVLVKPFARVTKSIEDLTDGYQNEEISCPGLYRDSTYYGCVQQNAFQNEDSG